MIIDKRRSQIRHMKKCIGKTGKKVCESPILNFNRKLTRQQIFSQTTTERDNKFIKLNKKNL